MFFDERGETMARLGWRIGFDLEHGVAAVLQNDGVDRAKGKGREAAMVVVAFVKVSLAFKEVSVSRANLEKDG